MTEPDVATDAGADRHPYTQLFLALPHEGFHLGFAGLDLSARKLPFAG
jgi:hypothetical protein